MRKSSAAGEPRRESFDALGAVTLLVKVWCFLARFVGLWPDGADR
jgi:hypothetical protein